MKLEHRPQRNPAFIAAQIFSRLGIISLTREKSTFPVVMGAAILPGGRWGPSF
jgi:hypothetical protein